MKEVDLTMTGTFSPQVASVFKTMKDGLRFNFSLNLDGFIRSNPGTPELNGKHNKYGDYGPSPETEEL